jgi:hypothetical protein
MAYLVCNADGSKRRIVSVPNRQLTIYEINTWVWLSDLIKKSGGPVTLGSVPSAEWDAIAHYGFDAVWLMGVWERSPAGINIANGNADLVTEFHRTLPDFVPEDNVGSAYCVRRYVVDQHLGGPEGLATARQELARRGMGLILDFVPNHVAPDSPWIVEHPEHFMQGSAAELERDPAAYMPIGAKIFARGRDPYFPPWSDVVQVNAFAPGFRQAVIELLLGIAEQCDGIRCDMAMLLMNEVFAQTWASRAGLAPATEYWPTVIGAVKKEYPLFLFIAEAYWDLEWELQQQGFDLCYDKRLYDRLAHDQPEGIRLHLCADLLYQEKLLRFIENHDEPRASAAFPPAKARAAAIIMTTIPGAKLFHEGQFEGRRIKVPTFLGRRPEEPVDIECHGFYEKLLAIIHNPVFRDGKWTLCPCVGWPDNQSYQKLEAWCWTKDEDRRLIVVNPSNVAVEARVHLPWDDLRGKVWRLEDALSNSTYDRHGTEIQNDGLYVELAAWTGQIFALRDLGPSQS